MKNILLIILSTFLSIQSTRALNTDSLTFEDQRSRVNSLLDQRSQRFGDFDTSLTQKTGLFGLFKTNADMQRSMDILQEIVKHDNKIFIETRKLLTIKDAQAERYLQLANEYDNQVTAYMKTISKLQVENEKLRDKHNDFKDEDRSDNIIIFTLSLLLVGALIIILRQGWLLKDKKLT